MGRLRVAVLMGGRSAEREVSLWSGRRVMEGLDSERYDAFPVDLGTLGRPTGGDAGGEARAGRERVPADAFAIPATPAEQWLLGARRPDVAFLCLHGRYGEDGTIQGMLELLGIPYTGSGVLASALAMNKAMSKTIFRSAAIPTPEDVTLTGRPEAEAFLRTMREGNGAIRLPVVVKPNEQGSTIGTSIVREPEMLAGALDTALAYDPVVLVERCIEGTEITAPVLGTEELTVLPLVEIVPSSGFYDYEQKYTPGATEEIVPARITAADAARARELATRAHRALGCRGVSRVDMMVDADDVWVLEVNTIPGMTRTSLLPRAAEAAGIAWPELLDRLIELALEGRAPAAGCRESGMECGV